MASGEQVDQIGSGSRTTDTSASRRNRRVAQCRSIRTPRRLSKIGPLIRSAVARSSALDLRPLHRQGSEILVGAPSEEQPQVRLCVQPRDAGVTAQIRSSRQPQNKVIVGPDSAALAAAMTVSTSDRAGTVPSQERVCLPE